MAYGLQRAASPHTVGRSTIPNIPKPPERLVKIAPELAQYDRSIRAAIESLQTTVESLRGALENALVKSDIDGITTNISALQTSSGQAATSAQLRDLERQLAALQTQVNNLPPPPVIDVMAAVQSALAENIIYDPEVADPNGFITAPVGKIYKNRTSGESWYKEIGDDFNGWV